MHRWTTGQGVGMMMLQCCFLLVLAAAPQQGSIAAEFGVTSWWAFMSMLQAFGLCEVRRQRVALRHIH
jgi:hypothetical protein